MIARKQQTAKKYEVLHNPGKTLLPCAFAKFITGLASQFFFYCAAGQIGLTRRFLLL